VATDGPQAIVASTAIEPVPEPVSTVSSIEASATEPPQ